jgi:hypothetical protein
MFLHYPRSHQLYWLALCHGSRYFVADTVDRKELGRSRIAKGQLRRMEYLYRVLDAESRNRVVPQNLPRMRGNGREG